ncbi:MAG TPA: zinc ABC transporter substrate-binding protein [Gaiellaceae bacterium]|nr:zinc ABC transporter substrate-binding protein [Gaiellaceae bacterium]
MSKWLVVGVALLVAVGCGRVESEGDEAGAGGLERIVATTGMIADAAESVGGERVRVTALMGPGVDPHLYKASEGDVQRLGEADLVLFNGLHLEAKLGDVLEELGDRSVAVAEAIPEDELLAPPEFQGQFDPHVWFDVDLWTSVVERIRDTFVERDPGRRSEYERNAERYLAELSGLEAEVRRELATVPERQRVLVTAHDAFNYFGRAYGFEVRGLQGISTATEAGAADVQELARFIADRKIATIFVETSVSSRAIDAVREAVRARGHDVRVGERLFSDAMGDPGTPEGEYVGMIRHNVRAIVDGLR